jgi:hypothetical protein
VAPAVPFVFVILGYWRAIRARLVLTRCLLTVTLAVRELREGCQGSRCAQAGRRFMIVEDRACYALAILHDHGNERVLKIKPAG